MKSHHYSQHAVALRAELGARPFPRPVAGIPSEIRLAALYRGGRQSGILGLTTWALIRFENPLVWIPLVLVQGFTIFNFTIVLHEVVHHTIFARRRRTVDWSGADAARRAHAAIELP